MVLESRVTKSRRAAFARQVFLLCKKMDFGVGRTLCGYESWIVIIERGEKAEILKVKARKYCSDSNGR